MAEMELSYKIRAISEESYNRGKEILEKEIKKELKYRVESDRKNFILYILNNGERILTNDEKREFSMSDNFNKIIKRKLEMSLS